MLYTLLCSCSFIVYFDLSISLFIFTRPIIGYVILVSGMIGEIVMYY